jgi:hypothetical protein
LTLALCCWGHSSDVIFSRTDRMAFNASAPPLAVIARFSTCSALACGV